MIAKTFIWKRTTNGRPYKNETKFMLSNPNLSPPLSFAAKKCPQKLAGKIWSFFYLVSAFFCAFAAFLASFFLVFSDLKRSERPSNS